MAAVVLLAAALYAGITFFSRLKNKPLGRRAEGFTVYTAYGTGAREQQQDNYCVSDTAQYRERGIMLCLADGMGGLDGGDSISKTAVIAAVNAFNNADPDEPELVLLNSARAANSSVNAYTDNNSVRGGTTLIIGYVYCGKYYFCSVGDSRTYLFRKNTLYLLNRQHTLQEELVRDYINEVIDCGSLLNAENTQALTNYIGMGAIRYLDMPVEPVSLNKGDKIVLASDGVFNTLEEDELIHILSGKGDTAQRIEAAILEKSKKYQDNFTALVLSAE